MFTSQPLSRQGDSMNGLHVHLGCPIPRVTSNDSWTYDDILHDHIAAGCYVCYCDNLLICT